jgi:hypothetical protein
MSPHDEAEPSDDAEEIAKVIFDAGEAIASSLDGVGTSSALDRIASATEKVAHAITDTATISDGETVADALEGIASALSRIADALEAQRKEPANDG